MNRQLNLTAAKPTQEIKIDHAKGPTSIVANPASATYSAWLTCTPQSVSTKVWAPIAALTAKTDLQTAEVGPVTGLRFTLTAGTSATVDVAQAD